MDSLNFESQNEIADIKNEKHPSYMHTNGAKECQSPALGNPKEYVRKRISTPADAHTEIPFDFSNNLVSPVLESNNRAEIVEEDRSYVDGKGDCKYSRQIDSWDFPQSIVDKYKLSGISEMFEWQRECLLTGNAFNGGMYLYCILHVDKFVICSEQFICIPEN